MKFTKTNALLTIALFLLSFGLNAQAPCATEYPAEMENWLKNYKANNPYSKFKKSANSTLYVPIVAHIVGNDAGAGYYRTDYLMDAMCNINVQFAPVDFYFYLEDVNYINSTSLFEHSGNYNNVIQATKYPNALNMYFVQDPNGACGYYSGWQDIIAINKSCGGIDNSTIAHEIGHYMSLPHTFYGWEGRNPQTAPANSTDERVSGSNCSSAGDFFCDTPADYISDRWLCPYTDNKLDYTGTPYQPDGELYMSYANDNCQNYFSNEQIDAMRNYLQNNSRRSGHLGYVPSNIDPLPVSTQLFPVDSLNYSPPSNYVELKWDGVDGAEYYSVMLTQGSNPNFFLMDTIVRDTSILIRSGLQPNFSYRWRVSAFHEGNTCSGYTDFQLFSASSPIDFEPSITINAETCNRFDASVDISVVGNGAPFTYEWSNGVSGNNISGMTAGNYLVTITASNNDDLVVPVTIPFGGDIDVEFQEFGPGFNSIRAIVKSGVGPYTYEWSNQSNDQSVELTNPGNYSVTVTDAAGCTATKTYTFTSLSEIVSEESLSIYPNPVNNGTSVNLNFTSSKQAKYKIQLIDLSGKIVKEENKEMLPGNNIEQFNIESLAKGVYIFRISANELNLNRKLYIY